MDNLTIKSTVRKDQLSSFLCDIKNLFERVSHSSQEHLRIKTIHNREDDDYCEVTVSSLKDTKDLTH